MVWEVVDVWVARWKVSDVFSFDALDLVLKWLRCSRGVGLARRNFSLAPLVAALIHLRVASGGME